MEQLLAVEIIRDHCRCCLKSFSSIQQTRVQVTPQLQEVFLGFLNEEVNCRLKSCPFFIPGLSCDRF